MTGQIPTMWARMPKARFRRTGGVVVGQIAEVRKQDGACGPQPKEA